MILKIPMRSLWQMKAILTLLRLWHLPKDQWKRLYIVCEEWLTNCLKYQQQPKCWIRIQKHKATPVVCLIDNGIAFNPFVKNDQTIGLRLMTELLPAKYRRFKSRNALVVCL